jgi:protein involved in polysaccharide export with SLBB domain
VPFSPIKQQIRERFGSIKAFEIARGLRPHAVRDHLRGKSVSQAEVALLAEFGAHDLEQPRRQRRRGDLILVERSAAERLAAMRLVELQEAITRAEEAVATLKGLLPDA